MRAIMTILRVLLVIATLGVVSSSTLFAQTVARCGEGWLEKIDGYPVLHLKGSNYEMGYQHGALLKELVRSNLHNVLVKKGEQRVKLGFVTLTPRAAIESIVAIQKPYVPQRFFDELQGLAAGCGLPERDIIAANFIPELFHCSGFAVMNSATADGTLYHGRVLDYAIDWGLQEHAVIIVAEPERGHPFVNVSYAGFIGSVTGMNVKHVSIGEMGGGGLGHWAGVPMTYLVRMALEEGDDLETALEVFHKHERTCQYFYVVADGKANRAVGMEASWNVFTLVQPGEKHPLLPRPLKDAVLLSAGDRYRELVRRAEAGHGKLDAESARRLMDCPVAMKSNLHNVLFEPKSTRFWVANASADQQPAAMQKYYAFQLSELLRRKPEGGVPRLTLPRRGAGIETNIERK